MQKRPSKSIVLKAIGLMPDSLSTISRPHSFTNTSKRGAGEQYHCSKSALPPVAGLHLRLLGDRDGSEAFKHNSSSEQ